MRSLIALNASLMTLLLVAGCDEPKQTATAKHTRKTIGEKTQKVLKLEDALASGGQLAATGISASDPLTQNAEAYRTSVGKIGGMAVEQAIQIRNAQNIADPKPLKYDEFMAEIIKPGKPDGINLAMLPYYQDYAWDEAQQKLVVIDFPAKKEAFKKDQDKELGRK
jgi:hypothetical protein